MGDRRTCELRTSRGSLFVYTHDGGFEMPDAVRAAVNKASPRIGSPWYWLRIMVDQLTRDGRDRETGFGLALQPGTEDEYALRGSHTPSIVVDMDARVVHFQDRRRGLDWSETFVELGVRP